jgi:hypothetical protein
LQPARVHPILVGSLDNPSHTLTVNSTVSSSLAEGQGDNSTSSNNVAAIVGGVVGGVLGLTVVAAAAVALVRCRRNAGHPGTSDAIVTANLALGGGSSPLAKVPEEDEAGVSGGSAMGNQLAVGPTTFSKVHGTSPFAAPLVLGGGGQPASGGSGAGADPGAVVVQAVDGEGVVVSPRLQGQASSGGIEMASPSGRWARTGSTRQVSNADATAIIAGRTVSDKL